VEHLRIVRELGLTSYICVPLVARGRTIGVLWLASEKPERRYGAGDVAVAEELARRAALAVDNARLYSEAQEAVRARDAFLARASHELRTPLTSALGTVRLLGRALGGEIRQRPEELVDMAARSLDSMAALINDLLDVSKLTAGAETVSHEAVDVARFVARGLEIVAPQAREKGVSLQAAVPEGLVVPGDPQRLEQVVVNLVGNAVKFTPPGGEVRVEADAAPDEVVLRVRDTGEGIPPEQLEAIFQPFFRSARRAARAARGTGLGLSICRQILDLHGGRIRAESDGPGSGSTFVVALPAAARDPRAA
jgi:signal transduction histidine kinase